MNLAFGRNRGIPEDVTTAWGARLIAPNDLLHDRQDLVADSAEAKTELVAWLNGGAIRGALDFLRENYWQLRQDDSELVLYNDIDGAIVGSTQGSGGYVYLAGWLKPDRAAARALTVDHYSVERVAIEAERWHTHYGWSKAEAAKMGDSSSEVRVFAVYGDGTRRELEAEHAGSFEFGYGGSGPHETARAIVADRDGGDRTPADLQALVPEVFSPAGREILTLTVEAADVDARLLVAA